MAALEAGTENVAGKSVLRNTGKAKGTAATKMRNWDVRGARLGCLEVGGMGALRWRGQLSQGETGAQGCGDGQAGSTVRQHRSNPPRERPIPWNTLPIAVWS